jgi:hypothetical protein
MEGMIGSIETNFVNEAEKRMPYHIMEVYLGDDGQMVFPQRGSDHAGLHTVQYSHVCSGEGDNLVMGTTLKVHTPPSAITEGVDYEFSYTGGSGRPTVQRGDGQNQPVPVVSGDFAGYLEWVNTNVKSEIDKIVGQFGDAGEGVDDI